MSLALDQLRRDLDPIVRAIVADAGRQVATEVVVARGVQRLLIAIEGDERPAERWRRKNAEALQEMAALGNSRDAARIVAGRRSKDPNKRHNFAQRFRGLRRRQKK